MASTASRVNFFHLLSRLIVQARENQIEVMPTSVFRTAEEQYALFAAGKSRADGYVKLSAHQRWLACDLVIIRDGGLIWSKDPAYETLAVLWEALGGIAGKHWTNFPDQFHFEGKA